jgi:N-formylglutamate deformylase
MDSLITVADEAFAAAFRSGKIGSESFHHRDHLRLAWIEIRRLGPEHATEFITHGIRRFAAGQGAEARYNDTMTRFWLWAVNHAIGRHPDLAFEALLESEPHLLDKSLPFKHWSRETINRPEAKASWTEPDLRPMPA